MANMCSGWLTKFYRLPDQVTAPSYDRVNLSASVALARGVRLTAYVNNVLDSFDYAFPTSDPSLGGDIFAAPLPPSQFGMRGTSAFRRRVLAGRETRRYVASAKVQDAWPDPAISGNAINGLGEREARRA